MTELHNRTAAALIIGNELLSGKVSEQNLVFLSRALRSLGIALLRVVVVPDDVALIVDEIKTLSVAFDFLFTSGGIGPTHDDVTIAAVAEAFGTDVETNQDLADKLRQHFGENLKPGHLLLARVPRGCSLIQGDDERWPTILMRNVWVLPGVPQIFRTRLPTIKRHLAGGQPFVSRAVYTNLDEGTLVPLLDAIVERFPLVDVGSYPKWSQAGYRTKLTFDGLDPLAVEQALQAFVETLPPGEPQRVE